jgi:predicted metal-dependent hydrolase
LNSGNLSFTAQRQRRYRARVQAGECVVRVVVNREVIDFLVEKAKWLTDAEAETR